MRTLYGRSLRYFIAAIVVVAAISGFAAFTLMGILHTATVREDLSAAARMIAGTYPTGGEAGVPTEWLAALSSSVPADSGYRCTILLPDGTVLEDSAAPAETMTNHSDRPEIAAAVDGRSAVAVRRSATLGASLVYAAEPVLRKDRVIAVVRLSARLPDIRSRLRSTGWMLALAALLAVAVAAGASIIMGNRLSAPLVRLAERASSYRDGSESDITVSGRDDDTTEIVALADSMALLAKDLSGRIEAARLQAGRFSAILDSMADPVLALDGELRIVLSNPASGSLAYGDGMIVPGTTLLQAVPCVDLHDLASECLREGTQLSREIRMSAPERTFLVHAGRIPDTTAEGALLRGVVLVLSDITGLKRLETIRRDFVANVSHELRTPIQLIKGFAETLASADYPDRENTNRFLGIISRNADRMESIVSDLLSLARLEHNPSEWLTMEETGTSSVVEEAVDAVMHKLVVAEGRIVRSCIGDDIPFNANRGLIVQALVNLLDNAIVHGGPRPEIEILASLSEGTVSFRVADRGRGIPAADVPRLFERFYRVDSSRSRERGGTGLGLAIVRHIALVHGGGVSAKSRLGEGSTFEISIPAGRPAINDPSSPTGTRRNHSQ